MNNFGSDLPPGVNVNDVDGHEERICSRCDVYISALTCYEDDYDDTFPLCITCLLRERTRNL